MKIALIGMLLSAALSAAPGKVLGPAQGWLADVPVASMASGTPDLIGSARRFTGPDGEVVVLFRVAAPESSAAARLVFQDFALPEGAELYVYAEDGSAVEGPFTGAGPLRTGEFQTAAIAGREFLLELHLLEEQAGVPFRLAAIEAAAAGDNSLAPVAEVSGTPETRLSVFRGMVVQHQVIDGLGIWDGDMILGRVEELEPYVPGKPVRAAGAISSNSYRWPGGVIPYDIDPAMGNQGRITDAVNHWNTLLNGYLRLVPRTSESYYVRFTLASASTCSSYIGYLRMAGQPINIGDYCSTGNVIHEIGHAVGFYHEHTRSDRNTYVRINTANIDSSATGNFTIQSGSLNPTAYDYGSIMHYPSNAFSANGLPTIETIPAGIPIGQRSGLSSLDIAGAKALYPAGSTGGGGTTTPTTPTTVAVTLASNPTGRTLVADGSNVTASYTAQWTAGTPHTISAPTQTVGNTRYLFRSWSNGGPQTQTITTPSAATTYTASYSVQYKVTGSGNGNGSLATSPASADSYYNSGSAISMTAAPGLGSCLAGWQGVVSVNDTTISFSANQSYAVTAVFQSGAVTAPIGVSVPGKGGEFSIPVTATSGCIWKLTLPASINWLRIQNGGSGKGSGTVSLRADQNRAGLSRSVTIYVNGSPVVITQTAR